MAQTIRLVQRRTILEQAMFMELADVCPILEILPMTNPIDERNRNDKTKAAEDFWQIFNGDNPNVTFEEFARLVHEEYPDIFEVFCRHAEELQNTMMSEDKAASTYFSGGQVDGSWSPLASTPASPPTIQDHQVVSQQTSPQVFNFSASNGGNKITSQNQHLNA